jgi:hypothetical protein
MKEAWQQLYEAHLVTDHHPPTNSSTSVWYIHFITALSGWIAGILILITLAVVFYPLFKYSYLLISLGGLLLFILYALLKRGVHHFFEHMALSLSIAGQIMITLGLYHLTKELDALFWLAFISLQVLLIRMMPLTIHRFLSTCMALYGLFALFILLGLFSLFTPLALFGTLYLWLHEFDTKDIQTTHAIGYALTLTLICLLNPTLFGHHLTFWHPFHEISLVLPSFTMGILTLLVGFYHANRLLMTLGTIALLLAISSYYYTLTLTLLEKSMILGVLGITLLALRWSIFGYLLPKQGANDG